MDIENKLQNIAENLKSQTMNPKIDDMRKSMKNYLKNADVQSVSSFDSGPSNFESQDLNESKENFIELMDLDER